MCPLKNPILYFKLLYLLFFYFIYIISYFY
nr:MAG TPA: hypothetical protein [Caudoviricetes sp.]